MSFLNEEYLLEWAGKLMQEQRHAEGRGKGIILVIIAALFWGVSGTVAQYLFEHGFTVEWLVSIRLTVSGILMLMYARIIKKVRIWDIWRIKVDVVRLLLFSFFGMLAVQYTFFEAISHSNAATATVLQYLAPIIIVCYAAIKLRRIPQVKEIVAITFAVVGTFLLVTQGNFNSLSISSAALFWGIASAVALAIYTLAPHNLLARWGAIQVVGWSMLVAGVSFSIVHPPWNFSGEVSVVTILAVIFIVLFGTIIGFSFYLTSLKYITPSETSLLACIEPLSAAVLSVVWLQVRFGLMEWLGAICIIGTVTILSIIKEKEEAELEDS